MREEIAMTAASCIEEKLGGKGDPRKSAKHTLLSQTNSVRLRTETDFKPDPWIN